MPEPTSPCEAQVGMVPGKEVQGGTDPRELLVLHASTLVPRLGPAQTCASCRGPGHHGVGPGVEARGTRNSPGPMPAHKDLRGLFLLTEMCP